MHAITYFYRFLFISLSGILWLVPQYCFSRSDAIVTSKSMVKLRQLAIRHSHTLALAVKLDPTNNQPPSKTTIEAAAAATTAPRNNHTESVDDARNSFKYHLEVYLRALYLLVLFLPLLLLAPMAYLSPGFREKFWFPLLKTTIAHSGAAFVKWGQWASTRSDMFPRQLCQHLAMLQDQAPSHSYYFSKQQVEYEFQRPLSEVFQSFDPIPIASGSIAQVHRAQYNNEKVAVKIRHPGVEEQIKLDFDIMIAVAKWIESFQGLEWLSLSESLLQFSHTIASQTNLVTEGESLLRFANNFKHWKDVDIPIPKVMKSSVIIETFLEGKSVSVALKEPPLVDPYYLDTMHYIVTRGEDLYFNMLLKDNFVHADLHPGNILFHREFPNNDLQRPPQHTMQMVDAGMVAELTEDQQTHFIGLMEAVGEGRGDEAADCVLQFSYNQKFTTAQRAGFKADMMTLFTTTVKGYHHDVDIGVVLRAILDLVRKHRITIEANYATLVLNALCLDGMAQSLLPSYSVMDGAKYLLKLNRYSKKLPFGLAPKMRKVFWPVILWLKGKVDQQFLKKLKRLTPVQLEQLYRKSKKFVV